MRLFALVLLAALPAAALDPRFDWQTLESPHFQVHYHQGMYRYAQRAARAAELAHERLVPLLDHLPAGRTQLVVQDDTDFANGNASPLLYDLIHAYAAPPDSRSTLADFDENVYELISHEYTHILHLDTVLGIPDAVNSVFGKIWITNGGQPTWFIEGMATFAESEVSAAGRLRSSSEAMMVRAEVLEGGLPRIDTLSSLPLAWPRGFGQYTVGSRFLSFIGQEYGLGGLRDLSHDFGGRVIPFALNLSAQRVLGSTYLDLYDQYAAFELGRAEQLQERVRAAGETQIEPLTRLGEWVRTPRWSPDGGTLYYTNSGPDRLPEVRSLRPGPCCGPPLAMTEAVRPSDRHVANLWSDGAGDATLAVAPAGAVVYARPEIYQEFELLQDLYSVDPRTGDETRLSRGLRASRPDVGPDGTLAFVWRRPGGRTAIAEMAPGATPRVLFEDPEGEPVDSPRFSPDGKRVAFLHHRDGGWDLRIVERGSLAVTDVTRDRALDRDPAWTRDGRWLLFSSDRTGVYDVYAWRPGELRQVTNVVMGAFEPEPSPDGTQLAVVTYGVRGYDVGRMPLDPSSWRAVTGPIVAEQRPAVTALPPEEVYPTHPYSPWSTLRPQFWLPYAASDAYGTTLGALTAGFDAVDRHEYAAVGWWSLSGNAPGWDAIYLNHSFYPDLTFETTRDLDLPQAAGGLDAPGYYYERSVGGSLTASFPFSQIERTHALSFTYELRNLTVDQNPLGVATSPGLLAAATIAYSYSDARRFVRSISTEQGQRFTLALRVSDPALGSAFSFWQASASASKYIAMPFSAGGIPWHHVLALRGSLGVARGDLSNRHDFFLGGFQQADLGSILNPAAAPLRVLRGFAVDAFHGTEYGLISGEYRFPVWNVETGPWTLPVYLRRLHGAVFTDVGDAFTPGRGDFHLHAGSGAELRAEIVLGWIVPTDLRLGCARGLESSPAAILECYVALGGVY